MKTLTIYALVLGVSMTTVLDSLKEQRPSYYAPLEAIELEAPAELLESFKLPGLPESVAVTENKKKAYHIYFENDSNKPIDVAIRFRDKNGDWQQDGLTQLNPGEKKKMGETIDRTYYYYASNLDLKASDKESYKFPIQEKPKKKLRFLKEDIWECYNSEMCNAFAVFR